MEKGTFKAPLYWLNLWKGLSNREVGIICRAVMRCADGKKVEIPIDESPEMVSAFITCVEDILYQENHPRAYKKPESSREIRCSKEYCEWRSAVYERDGYTCQNCKKVGGKLNAHHIKPFAIYPELRFDVDNGVTLCAECHKLAHKCGFRNVRKETF